jgi:hypothetical protein
MLQTPPNRPNFDTKKITFRPVFIAPMRVTLIRTHYCEKKKLFGEMKREREKGLVSERMRVWEREKLCRAWCVIIYRLCLDS